MAKGFSIDNCLIQVRSCLQDEGIKLWLEPYYIQGIGSVDSEMEVILFKKNFNFSENFNNASYCEIRVFIAKFCGNKLFLDFFWYLVSFFGSFV